MAQTINAAPMRRERQAISGFHWFLLLLVVAVTFLISTPSLFLQPKQYDSSAVITLDPTRYRAFVASPDLQKQLCNASTARVNTILPKFGNSLFGAECVLNPAGGIVAPDGTIQLKSHAQTASEAQAAADLVAQKLVQQIRADAGRDFLRRLMEAELNRVLQSQPAVDELGVRLRQLIGVQAFDFAIHASPDTPRMNDNDFNDLIRALEVRYDELAAQLGDASLGADKRTALRQAYQTIGRFLGDVLYPDPRYHAEETKKSVAYISQRAVLPAEPRSQRLGLKLTLVGLVGLLGGIFLVFVDRAVGIVAKIQELWQFRELIRNLVVRDLKARYKNSALGYVWSLLNPLLMILVFYLVFGFLFGSPITYFHVFLMVALLPWNYFVSSVAEGLHSIVGNGNLVKKVYFPREILPISTMFSNLINFLLSLPVLFAVILITGSHLNKAIVLLPVLIVIQSIFILGMILFFSAISVPFRDTAHIMGIILQLWFFVTPVFYPLEQIASGFYAKLVRWLNPMASIVDFYRDILYGGYSPRAGDIPVPGFPSLDGIARTGLTAIIVLAIGAYVFHRLSPTFGEEL